MVFRVAMSCNKCKRFPAPTSTFKELGISIERHGVLYKCKHCNQLFEVIAEERSHRLVEISEIEAYYEL